MAVSRILRRVDVADPADIPEISDISEIGSLPDDSASAIAVSPILETVALSGRIQPE